MASEADIMIVQDNLPSEAIGEGWDEEKIGLLLDSGLSTSKVVRQWWSNRSAATAGFVNVSESGSSRSLSDIHKQALGMLKYWDDVIRLEEQEAEEEETPGRIAFHRAVRG